MVVDGDTLIAITVQDGREINQAFLDGTHYKIVNDSLNQKVLLLNERIEGDSVIIGNQKIQIYNLEQIITNEQGLTERCRADLKDTDTELVKERKKNKFIKPVAIGSIILNVILIVVIGISN